MQRVVTEAERERVRQRGLEAENQRKGRTAQVLDRAPKLGQGKCLAVHGTDFAVEARGGMRSERKSWTVHGF